MNTSASSESDQTRHIHMPGEPVPMIAPYVPKPSTEHLPAEPHPKVDLAASKEWLQRLEAVAADPESKPELVNELEQQLPFLRKAVLVREVEAGRWYGPRPS